MGGGSLISVHLGTANSQAEFKERIAQFAKTLPKGAWLATAFGIINAGIRPFCPTTS
jgi:hypothetical protein